jgi:hypothetical protein
MMFARLMVNMVGLLGAAAMLGASIALTLPLGLAVVDRTGAPISCGTGLNPSYDAAAKQDLLNLDQHTLAGPAYATSDYTEQCKGLVTDRRMAALSVGGGGAVLLLAALAGPSVARALASRRGRQAEYARAAEPVGDQPHHAGVQAQGLADEIPTGVTQPILEEPIGKQVGRQCNAAAAALALRGNGFRDASFGDAGRSSGGIGQLHAIARNG